LSYRQAIKITLKLTPVTIAELRFTDFNFKDNSRENKIYLLLCESFLIFHIWKYKIERMYIFKILPFRNGIVVLLSQTYPKIRASAYTNPREIF
jgi:hypothetical protein